MKQGARRLSLRRSAPALASAVALPWPEQTGARIVDEVARFRHAAPRRHPGWTDASAGAGTATTIHPLGIAAVVESAPTDAGTPEGHHVGVDGNPADVRDERLWRPTVEIEHALRDPTAPWAGSASAERNDVAAPRKPATFLAIPRPRRACMPVFLPARPEPGGPPPRGGVSTAQRLVALAVLQQREPHLSYAQGVAVIDAAAEWLNRSAGDEFAWALLELACSSPTTTGQAYLALLAPTHAGTTERDG